MHFQQEISSVWIRRFKLSWGYEWHWVS